MNPLYLVHLKGTQADMGAQYGAHVKDYESPEIMVNYFSKLVYQMLSTANHRRISERLFLAALKPVIAAGLIRMGKHRPSEYVERSEAFLDAVGLEKNIARHAMLMDVFQNVVGYAGRLKLGPFARHTAQLAVPACSSLMVWDEYSRDGSMRHARNFDFPAIGIWDIRPTVVFCTPDKGQKYGYVSSLALDLPGVTAFNESGLTVAMHTRFHRDVAFDGAAVVDVGHDIVRRAESVSDAIAICRERKVASTWGVAVTSARDNEAAVLETTAAGTVVVKPGAKDSYLVCANRNRHPSSMRGQVEPMPGWAEHSDAREARLHQLAAEGLTRQGLTCEELQQALGDHCDPYTGEHRAGGGILSQAMTVQSVVVEAAHQRVNVSVGNAPTGLGPYVAVDWDWDREVGITELPPTVQAPANETQPDEGYVHWAHAFHLNEVNQDAEETLPLVEKAVAAAPKNPTYRFMAGVIQLRQGEWQLALTHFEVALTYEHSPFRRGQLLLWGSRAADQCGQKERAAAMRDELLSLQHTHLHSHHANAREEQETRYSTKRLRSLVYQMSLLDAM